LHPPQWLQRLLQQDAMPWPPAHWPASCCLPSPVPLPMMLRREQRSTVAGLQLDGCLFCHLSVCGGVSMHFAERWRQSVGVVIELSPLMSMASTDRSQHSGAGKLRLAVAAGGVAGTVVT
jgi:hypothetical protein